MVEATQEAAITNAPEEAEHGTSLWVESYYRFKKNKMAVISIFYLLFQTLLAIFAPMLTSFSYEETDLILGAVAPNSTHWFGTDELGRDLFTRTLYGARISLAIGLLAVVVSLVIGTLYGAISGYFGGRIDYFMQRFLEILYAIPFMILVIILLTMFGHNIFMLFIALGAIQWLTMARIVRGQVISLKEMEFVEAARCMGVSRIMIIMRHMIPNILGPVIVYTTLGRCARTDVKLGNVDQRWGRNHGGVSLGVDFPKFDPDAHPASVEFSR